MHSRWSNTIGQNTETVLHATCGIGYWINECQRLADQVIKLSNSKQSWQLIFLLGFTKSGDGIPVLHTTSLSKSNESLIERVLQQLIHPPENSQNPRSSLTVSFSNTYHHTWSLSFYPNNFIGPGSINSVGIIGTSF